MARQKQIATLLRSIADLLDDDKEVQETILKSVFDHRFVDTKTGEEKQKYRSGKVRVGYDVGDENPELTVLTEDEINSQLMKGSFKGELLIDDDIKKIDEVVNSAPIYCNRCTNGGRGRHNKGCPRGAGVVTVNGEKEIRHACCGSKGSRHKADCTGIVSTPPQEAEEAPAKEEAEEKDEDRYEEDTPAGDEKKAFECGQCGKSFEADPNDARCVCGSNEIWPVFEA